MGLLFNYDYGENTDPIEDPEITQVIFYFSKEDAVLFKKLCKEGMKVEFPKTYIEDGNITDLLYKIVKEKYEHLLPKKTNVSDASGETEGEVP